MTFVTLSNDGHLWYSIRSASSPKTPLVLVQGRGLDHHGWDSVLNEFTNRPIILIDHRGTGQSTASLNSEWSTRDFANDVVTILDHAGIDRAHVYGHSMGGRIAQWLGAEHADRIITLTIGGTSVGDGTGLPRPTIGAAALASGDPSALASLFYPDDWVAANPQQAISVLPEPHSPEAMSIHSKASDRPDGPVPEKITIPTLILHGANDPISDPDNAAILGKRIPNSEVFMVPDARHAYWAGNPKVHASVAKFLSLNAPNCRLWFSPSSRQRLGVHTADMADSTVDAVGRQPRNLGSSAWPPTSPQRSCPLCGHRNGAGWGLRFPCRTYFSYKRLPPDLRGLQENAVLAVEVCPRS